MLMAPILRGIWATRPLMAEVRNEVGEDRHPVFAVLPGKLHAPIHLLSRLNPTAVKVSPSYPIPMGRRRKIWTISFKTGKLLVAIAVDV